MLFMVREDGNLTLDDPLGAHLPGFADAMFGRVANATAAENHAAGQASAWIDPDRVTLRALAMHAAGMRRNDIADTRCDAATLEACEARNLGALASKAPESRLLFAPYEHTLYSNLGYALLGQACARAAGVGFQEFVQTRILDKLGMGATGFNYNTVEVADGYDPSRGMGTQTGGATKDGNFAHRGWHLPSGGAYSSAKDMEKLLHVFLPSSEKGRAAGAALGLPPTVIAEMLHTVALQGGGGSAVSAGGFEALHVGAPPFNRWAFTKAGNYDGYRTTLAVVPSLSVGVFAVAASSGDLRGNGDAVALPLLAELLPAVEAAMRAAVDDVPGRDLRAETSAAGAPHLATAPAGLLEAVQGTYCRSRKSGPVEVRANATEGGTLYMLNWFGGGSLPARLEWVGGTSFVMRLDARRGDYFSYSYEGPGRGGNGDPGASRDECEVDEATGKSLCTSNCLLKFVKGDREVVTFKPGLSFWMTGLRNKCKLVKGS